MEGPELFVACVAAYALTPLVLAIRQTVFQFVLLYGYIATVMVVAGLVGLSHELPLTDTVSVSAGETAYAGLIFAILVTVVVGRDLQVVRNVVVLVLGVHVLLTLVYFIDGLVQGRPRVNAVQAIPAELAGSSPWAVLLAGLLVAAEVVLLVWLLEMCKRRVPSLAMVLVYPAAITVTLLVDGLLHPLVVRRAELGLLEQVGQEAGARLLLAWALIMPVFVFVALYRKQVLAYEEEPLRLDALGRLSRDELLLGRATATVERILDAAVNTLLVAMDTDLRITHFNVGAEQLLGYTADEMRGRTTAVVIDYDEGLRHAMSLGTGSPALDVLTLAQVAHGGRREWELVGKDGQRHIVSLSVSEIVAGGRVVGYLAAGEDVTSRVRSERAMLQAMSREHTAALALQEAEGVKHELVSTVSHELRTPITSITGYTELLEEGVFGDLNERQTDALRRVIRNTERLENLVEDLLVLERAESGLLQLDRTPIDLRDVVGDVQDMLTEMVRGRDLELRLELEHGPIQILGDHSALERVVLNLVSNAVKFTPAGGRITVEAHAREGSAGLLVSDTGVGISAEDQERLFERFFRTHESYKKAVPGTGLGLSIVQAIVAGHDGKVTVMSAPGRGTTFAVSIPLDARLGRFGISA
ncbi:sensor histidine kinase [Nocardioides campestrisoli]|uniref:sensor histidine kinase n=1 Tax=Nocardioides campestrisoli TaxID=2736757 RepID=UPI0015E67D7B|nr:ATP-binding protein [Nocardioides campestrisoli]